MPTLMSQASSKQLTLSALKPACEQKTGLTQMTCAWLTTQEKRSGYSTIQRLA